jgi:glucose/arabinose dehydrogenase
VTLRRLACLAALAAVAACSSGSASPQPSRSGAPSHSPVPTPSAELPSPTPTPTPLPVVLAPLGDYSTPIWVGPAPGDRAHLYLAERTGRVLQLSPEGARVRVVLDLSDQISRGAEQGLLSIAFDPRYATNHRMYVNYTDKAGDTKVVAYEVTDGKAAWPEELLHVGQPYVNHNGGLLLFDRTGMLLVGLGDGGSAGDPQNRSQDLTSDLGKILRLDPDNGAPAAGNPYPQNPKVWALGLRNPWRFSFDTNGDLYLGDVGQNKVEELDVVAPRDQRGANYGWPVFEGSLVFKLDQPLTTGGALIAPALTYEHADGGCSITGGAVYRGKAIPRLVGTYVFGDYCAGRLLGVQRTPSGVTEAVELGPKVDGLSAFGSDLDGEMLVMSQDTLYRLLPG